MFCSPDENVLTYIRGFIELPTRKTIIWQCRCLVSNVFCFVTPTDVPELNKFSVTGFLRAKSSNPAPGGVPPLT